MNKLGYWSWQRQMFNRQSASIPNILEQIIGVYSTNPSTTLSLWARFDKDKPFNLLELEQQKQVIRMPGIRGSVFLLRTDDASQVRSACLPPYDDPCWDERYADVRRYVDPDIQKKLEDELNILFAQPIEIKEFREKTGVDQAMAKPMINKLCLQGKLNRVGADTLWANKLLYVSTEAWLGKPILLQDQDQALVELSKKYFKAFGPASMKDLAWWLNITQSVAKGIIDQLPLVEVESNLLLLREDEREFKTFTPQPSEDIRILPQWDSYTMAYAPAGRSRLVGDDHLSDLYGKIGATGGNAKPCIMVGPAVVATWTPKKKGDKLDVEIQAFDKLSAKIKKAIGKEFEELASFLKLKSINLSFA